MPVHKHHSHKRRSNRNKRTWGKAAGRKADAQLAIKEMEGVDMKWDQEWVEDIADREWEGGNWSEWCLQSGATWEDVRDWSEWKEIGETFSKWGQRRINEMRQVKEDRLTAKLAAISTGQLSSSTQLTTTLPTTPDDIDGHAKLDFLLRESLQRRWNKFPSIVGYSWFGEYEWYWHRNMSGCFELCSWTNHSSCYCELYASCGKWSPEDRVQTYTLEEFFVPPIHDGKMDEDAIKELYAVYNDVDDMHAEVMEFQAIVEHAHGNVMEAHREVYQEGLGNEDDDIQEVYGRMAEVYGEMYKLQQGLVQIYEGYNAMYDDMNDSSTEGKEAESEDEKASEHGDEIVEDGWDIVSLPPLRPSLSTTSSWSVVDREPEMY
ncbi:hypothetical protein N0V90_004358 [Kalmusia sp. IMI 367209]|nr:hypothetical protein N0V90_004358 [Kalmusia sp. IMI 367209]